MSARILSMMLITLVLFGSCSTLHRPAIVVVETPRSLDDLLQEYKKLGLPLPPKDAKLVYIKYPDFVVQMVFVWKPASAKEYAIALEGTRQHEWKFRTPEFRPDPKVVGDSVPEHCLVLALQCHHRGWDDLARHLLVFAENESVNSLHRQLIWEAWNYWWEKVTEPDIDRAPVAKRLHEIQIMLGARDYARSYLKGLDAALIPSQAKPGTIEALIDDLVDYVGTKPDERYNRIANLGFEAVPQLIDHLNDERLTRSTMQGPFPLDTAHVYVGDVVSDLLYDLAGPAMRRQPGRIYRPEKAEVQKWWETARDLGEEAYLLRCVLPPLDQLISSERSVNIPAARLIGVKYPKHLPSLYRNVLENRPDQNTWELSEIVMKAAIPAEEKLDLLALAVRHKDSWHRLPALHCLSKLDKQLFAKLLAAAIDELPKDRSNRGVWIAHLVMETDDARAWQALEKAVARASPAFKMELLDLHDSSKEVRHRSKRLHLLTPYLDDATVYDPGVSNRKIEVRDFVAMKIADLIGIDVEREERTPEDWAKVRNQVRKALEREPAKEAKQ